MARAPPIRGSAIGGTFWKMRAALASDYSGHDLIVASWRLILQGRRCASGGGDVAPTCQIRLASSEALPISNKSCLDFAAAAFQSSEFRSSENIY